MAETIEDYAGTAGAWDAFVRARGGSFCHLWGWRRVIEDVCGHATRYRAALDERGDLSGVLPLVHVRSRLFGRFLLSMPFLNYGGPLGSASARAALARDACALARGLSVDLLELRAREPIDADLATSHRKITVVRDLPASGLWEAIPGKVRSQVRRPQKEGMEFRCGPEQAGAFYDVFAHNMRDLGTPVLPERFFGAIREHLGEYVVFSAVHHQGRAVAAGCGFVFGDEYEMTWASSLREFNRLAPNMLLYWGCMEEMARRGLKVFNFGRCTPESGTHRFKLQWGARDVPLPWAQWSRSGVAATPSPDRPVFRLATAVWSHLPLAIANRVGPLLSTRLP